MTPIKTAIAALTRPDVAAGISVPSAFVSWFAGTLPILQWLAAAIAILVGGLAIWKHFRRG